MKVAPMEGKRRPGSEAVCPPLVRLLLVFFMNISRRMVGFTLVVMSLAACADPETEPQLSEAGHST